MPSTVAVRSPNKIKSFRVSSRAARPEAEREPLAFDLLYTDEEGAEHHSDEFHARPWNISDVLLIELPNMVENQNSVPMWRIFEAALGTEYKAFDRFVHSPEVFVEAEQLLEIMFWLVEEATGRPIGPS